MRFARHRLIPGMTPRGLFTNLWPTPTSRRDRADGLWFFHVHAFGWLFELHATTTNTQDTNA